MAQAQEKKQPTQMEVRQQEFDTAKKNYQLWLVAALSTDSSNKDHPLYQNIEPSKLAYHVIQLQDIMATIRNGPKNANEKAVYDSAIAKYGTKDVAAAAFRDGLMSAIDILENKVKTKEDAGPAYQIAWLAKTLEAVEKDMDAHSGYFAKWSDLRSSVQEIHSVLEGLEQRNAPPLGTRSARGEPLPFTSVELPNFIYNPTWYVSGKKGGEFFIYTASDSPAMKAAFGTNSTNLAKILADCQTYTSNFPGGTNTALGQSLAAALNSTANNSMKSNPAYQEAINHALKGEIGEAVKDLKSLGLFNAFFRNNMNSYAISMSPQGIKIVELYTDLVLYYDKSFKDRLDAIADTSTRGLVMAGMIIQYDHMKVIIGGLGTQKPIDAGTVDLWTGTPYMKFNLTKTGKPVVLHVGATFGFVSEETSAQVPVQGQTQKLGDLTIGSKVSNNFIFAMTDLRLEMPAVKGKSNDQRVENIGVFLANMYEKDQGFSLKNPGAYTTIRLTNFKLGENVYASTFVSPRVAYIAGQVLLGATVNPININWGRLAYCPYIRADTFAFGPAEQPKIVNFGVSPIAAQYRVSDWLKIYADLGFTGSTAWLSGVPNTATTAWTPSFTFGLTGNFPELVRGGGSKSGSSVGVSGIVPQPVTTETTASPVSTQAGPLGSAVSRLYKDAVKKAESGTDDAALAQQLIGSIESQKMMNVEQLGALERNKAYLAARELLKKGSLTDGVIQLRLVKMGNKSIFKDLEAK